MSDYTLHGPDGGTVVTGDGAEKARLVAAGYTEAATASVSRPKPEPRPVDPKTVDIKLDNKA